MLFHRTFAFALTLVCAVGWLARTTQAQIHVVQGKNWTSATRDAFYSGDQGSQMIPLAWMQALKQADGITPFLAGSMSRYGYLPNSAGTTPDVPVGFSVAETSQGKMLGMTCAACHTREISAEGKTYRIDGGPAIVDFQSLLADLDAAVLNVLATKESFQPFAAAVLGPHPSDAAVAALKAEVTLWSTRNHVLMSKALPQTPWGPSRLDAVGMIYNRLTGLDLGPQPTYLIPDNIVVADAPTRYPFLWNAPVQSMTQWPGFAANGSDLYGLARNLGEVYGVFGTFHPTDADHWWDPINRHYNRDNSADYPGLLRLEQLVGKIGAPEWPWPHDEAMAARGKAIFNRPAPQGCVGCHGQTPGPIRYGTDPFRNDTWATPIQDVGTDTRESDLLGRPAESGSLAGAYIPVLSPTPLCQKDAAFNILAMSVLGGIVQYYAPLLQALPPEAGGHAAPALPLGAQPGEASLQASPEGQTELRLTRLNVAQFTGLRLAFVKPEGQKACTMPPPTHAYESRVLYGIWAVAPYLHNGSVPTLAELLRPSAQRVRSFKIGPAYDTVTVGLAVEQKKFDFTLVTTDCNHLSSGASNCGHEYGTTLLESEKRDLLEYLKVIKPD